MKYLIAGLGNIGKEYVDTRHNVGFMVAGRLAEKFNARPEPDRYAFSAKIRHKGRHLVLIMPTTYMNLSGKAIRYHMEKQKIPLENVLVITDDIALPFGRCRLKPSGSDGGHNGLKSINELLNTRNYPRMRIGVGNDFPKGRQVDYVLSPFTDEEFEQLPEVLDKCVNGILSFVSIGITRTMENFNRK